ncbi:hypothetical protein BC941DRAFT_168223 [Chlamydoabsidia padenii]|nr:hypothetical protein BC941DRAFT_168223 [Chlamydoabsidia padenii]
MLFEIANGPSVFSRMISMTLAPLHSCALAYIDDITVFSPPFDQLLEDLAAVFQRIKDCNLVFKCHLMTKTLLPLGFTADIEKGIMSQKNRLICLDHFPTPTNTTDVKEHLVFVRYFA